MWLVTIKHNLFNVHVRPNKVLREMQQPTGNYETCKGDHMRKETNNGKKKWEKKS